MGKITIKPKSTTVVRSNNGQPIGPHEMFSGKDIDDLIQQIVGIGKSVEEQKEQQSAALESTVRQSVEETNGDYECKHSIMAGVELLQDKKGKYEVPCVIWKEGIDPDEQSKELVKETIQAVIKMINDKISLCEKQTKEGLQSVETEEQPQA